MPLPSLTLFAREDSASPERAKLIARLQSIGLLGQQLDSSLFLSGTELFQHISFLGCAPSIPLTPGESDQFLRIQVPKLERAHLFTADNTRVPVCNTCRTPFAAWQSQLKGGAHILHCSNCRERTSVMDLKLGKRACYSRQIIQVAPVFEGEAVPSQNLLNELERCFDTPFAYAYTRIEIS